LLQYGIATEVSETRPVTIVDENGRVTTSGTLSGTYSYIINGKGGISTINGMSFNAKKGPSTFVFKNGLL